MTVPEFLFAVLLGFAAGFTSGALGVGGGVITTPAIRLLLLRSSDIALGTPLPITFPSALVGAINYWKAGKVDARVILPCSLFGLAGTTCGSLLTSAVDTRYLMILTSLVLLYLAQRTFATAAGKGLGRRAMVPRAGDRHPLWKLALTGFCAGFFSGLLGLGGGIILVPSFLFLLNLEIKQCLGNSLAVISILAVPGSIIHSLLGHVDWLIVMAMVIGVMPGSYTGSFFTLRARNRRVLLIFATLLAAIGIIFLVREVRGLL